MILILILKNNKAPGEDGVFLEMFKADEDRMPLILVKLLNKIKKKWDDTVGMEKWCDCQDSIERRFK